MMHDVEKYGFFTILVLLGLGGSLALQGCTGGEPETERRAQARGVVISIDDSAPTEPSRAEKRQREPRTLRIPTLLPEDEPFTFDEPPVVYPGENSTRPSASVAAEARRAAEPDPETERTVTVRAGDTLGAISSRVYGSSRHWRRIADANPGVDPDRLGIGATLVIPALEGEPKVVTGAAAAPVRATDGQRTYVVRSGDTLGEIAARLLGSASYADRLFEANADRLASPDELVVGQELIIP